MEHLPMIVIVGLTIIGIYFVVFDQSQVSIGGNKPIPTTIEPRFIRGPESADATLKVKYVPTGEVFTADMYHGKLLERPNNPFTRHEDGTETPKFEPTITEYRYVADPRFDIGIVAGIATGKKDKDDDFDFGIRVGFIRFFDDRLSPDLLITHQSVGGGISFFPATSTTTHFFRETGIEVGYVYCPGDDRWRVFLGLCTQLKF